jgi:hypothetical protein
MQNGERGFALKIHTEKAVPKRTPSDSGNGVPPRRDLPMQLIQAVQGVLREFVRVDLRAAVGRCANPVGNLRAKSLHLPSLGIE